MVNEYLEDDIKIDTGILLEAIDAELVAQRLSPLVRNLDVTYQELSIDEIVTDIKLSIGLDPFQARRAAHALKRLKYIIPSIQAELSYKHDDFVRINRTKAGLQKVAEALGVAFAKQEDAFILTATDVTVGDNEGIMQSGNFTDASAELIAYTYTAAALKTLSDMIGQAVLGDVSDADLNGMADEVRKNPLILVITPIVESLAAGTYNTTVGGDMSLLEAWDRMLKLRGGPGSGIMVSRNLGCAISWDGELKELTITPPVETSVGRAALVVVSPKVMTSWASGQDQRLRPYNKADGYYNKVVERYINLVHNKEGIVASHAVALAA